jgi:hypothetical protein
MMMNNRNQIMGICYQTVCGGDVLLYTGQNFYRRFVFLDGPITLSYATLQLVGGCGSQFWSAHPHTTTNLSTNPASPKQTILLHLPPDYGVS